jgi:hypothetical protein
MKKFPFLLMTALFILFPAKALFGQVTKPDHLALIKASHFLEEKPFDKDAKDIRSKAILFVIQTDDVSVTVCGGDLMAPILDKKNKNGSELIGQYTIGMAAYKLEKPDKKNDENAAQLAGLESTLKAYEAMVKEKPKTAFAGMDALVAIRNKGELKGVVDASDCTRKK